MPDHPTVSLVDDVGVAKIVSAGAMGLGEVLALMVGHGEGSEVCWIHAPLGTCLIVMEILSWVTDEHDVDQPMRHPVLPRGPPTGQFDLAVPMPL